MRKIKVKYKYGEVDSFNEKLEITAEDVNAWKLKDIPITKGFKMSQIGRITDFNLNEDTMELEISGETFNHYEINNVFWKKLKSKEYGFGIGGIAHEIEVEDGVTVIKDFELTEVSVVSYPIDQIKGEVVRDKKWRLFRFLKFWSRKNEE